MIRSFFSCCSKPSSLSASSLDVDGFTCSTTASWLNPTVWWLIESQTMISRFDWMSTYRFTILDHYNYNPTRQFFAHILQLFLTLYPFNFVNFLWANTRLIMYPRVNPTCGFSTSDYRWRDFPSSHVWWRKALISIGSPFINPIPSVHTKQPVQRNHGGVSGMNGGMGWILNNDQPYW